VTTRYHNVTMQFTLQGGANGHGDETYASGYARLKQQEPMGGPPVVEFFIRECKTLDESDFSSHIVVNSSARTVVDLYVRVKTSYQTYFVSPTFISGNKDPIFHEKAGFITSLPSGSKIAQRVLTAHDTSNVNGTPSSQITSRLSSAETSISQTAHDLTLKASQTSVDSLTSRMSTAESSISLQGTQIGLKVDKDGVVAAINLQPGIVRIDARLIDVGDFTNLIDNGTFEDDPTGSTPTGWGSGIVEHILNFQQGNGSARAMKLNARNGSNADAYQQRLIQVKEGDEFYMEGNFRFLNSAGTMRMRIGWREYDHKKSPLSKWISVASWDGANQTFRDISGSVKIPAGVGFIQPWVSFQNNGETTNALYIDNLVLRRKSNVDMIVNGAITANKMAVNSITAANGALANASIVRLNLQDGIVGTLQIDNLAVTTAKLANLAVDTGKIANLAVTDAKIASIKADKIDAGTITGSLLQTATSGKRVRIQMDDYAAYDGSTQKMSMGFRTLSSGNTDAPRFAMGVYGMDNSTTSAAGNYFVMTHYPANNNPQGNLDESYIDMAYRAATLTDYSNIKMYDKGDIRIAAIRDTYITTNYVNGAYAGEAERTIARFIASPSAYFNSSMEIGAVINQTNANGLILGDDTTQPYTRVRVQTDSSGNQFFRPLTNSGSIELGSSGFPWEKVFAVNGTIQSSTITKKSDITPVKINRESILDSIEDANTLEDNDMPTHLVTDFIHGVNLYSFAYKKGEEYWDPSIQDVRSRVVSRTKNEALAERDNSAVQIGIIAEEVVSHPISKYILSGYLDDNTLGVQVVPLLGATIITIQDHYKTLLTQNEDINWLKLENQYLKQKIANLEARFNAA
ncbi:hypothetical protein, partial [Qipengyuania zhejiangensis]|uniref:hypothetical protein n=1 Tax=Qipengyuania zhejiangensis TaxID=3077782 RepID=UPI002D7A3E74